MKTLNKISDNIDKAVGWFLIACFVLMTVAYFGQVVLRYVFQTGIHWSEEITRYTNIALVMFGSALMAKKNAHINVSILQQLVPKKAEKWVIILQQLLTMVFAGFVVVYSFQMIKIAGTQVSTNMRIPMKFVYAIFPIAFSLMVFNVIVFLLNSLTKKEEE